MNSLDKYMFNQTYFTNLELIVVDCHKGLRLTCLKACLRTCNKVRRILILQSNASEKLEIIDSLSETCFTSFHLLHSAKPGVTLLKKLQHIFCPLKQRYSRQSKEMVIS